MMEGTIIILNAKDYEITNDDGKVNKGVTIRYLFSDSMEPYERDGNRGLAVLKVSFPASVSPKIQRCPAVYKAKMDMMANKDMRAEMKPYDVDYLCDIGGEAVSKK